MGDDKKYKYPIARKQNVFLKISYKSGLALKILWLYSY